MKTMNDKRIHTVFALMSMLIPEIIIKTIRDPELTVDEILTGSMAALFNVTDQYIIKMLNSQNFWLKLNYLQISI